MKKRLGFRTAVLGLLWAGSFLLTAGCYYHHHSHPHGMPPGLAKKIVPPVQVQVTVQPDK